MTRAATPKPFNPRRAHRLIALALALFLVLHLGNHLFLLEGVEAHRQALLTLRHLYRAAPVETVLLALFAAQIALGLLLARRRGLGRGWAAAQVVSGLYLAFFLVQHVPAVLIARAGHPPIDTDARFAAAVLQGWGGLYFAPYYALAVAALVTHLAAALHARGVRARSLPCAGLILGVLIVAGLMGTFG
jgi:succinate dehydrogenase/fumarate reductase cytochrome b subunit